MLDRRSENGARKVDDDVRGHVREILAGRPNDHGFERPTWTPEILRAVIANVVGVLPSIAHVVVFTGEVDIHLNPKTGSDWMLPGTQRLVLTPGNNEKRYLAGAYEPLHDRLVYVEGDRKASWIFMNLLRALLETYDRAQTIHVILDNYIIHKSRVTQAWLAEFGERLRLHFLPPYCPSENRIERIWLDLHANVTRNHRQKAIGALLDRVHGYLAERFDTRRQVLRAA